MKKRRLTHVTLHPTQKGLLVPLPFVTEINGIYFLGYEDRRSFSEKEMSEAVIVGALWEIEPYLEIDECDHSRGTWLDDNNRIYWASLVDPMGDFCKKEIFLKEK